MDFNVTIHEKLNDMISDFTLQQSSEKLTTTDSGFNIKEEYPKLSEEAMKLLLPFLKYVRESPSLSFLVFSYTSNKPTSFYRLSEACSSPQMCSWLDSILILKSIPLEHGAYIIVTAL